MKAKEKLRILLGVFLCLGMIIGLMQVNVSQVQADEGHRHCVCGGSDLSADGHKHNASQEWKGVSDL